MKGTYVRPFPQVVRIEPSAACNLACSHCPTGTVRMARGVMQPETFARVLASIEKHRDAVGVVMLYHGGEPLLNKHFVEMVQGVKALGVPFVKSVSNGMLVTQEAARGIVVAGLDEIEFSLDGQSPEENDVIRRNGSFSTVARNIWRLAAHKHASYAHHPRIFLSSTQFLGNGEDPSTDPSPPAYLLKSAASGAIAGFKCTWVMRGPHMEVSTECYRTWQRADETSDRNVCDHVDHTVTVTWNGDVVGSSYDLTRQLVLGKVRSEPGGHLERAAIPGAAEKHRHAPVSAAMRQL